MFRVTISALILVATTVVGCDSFKKNPNSSNTTTPAQLKVWVSDKSLQDQLQDEQPFYGYSFRPPINYKMQKIEKEGFHVAVWEGPLRKDDSRPKIILIVGPILSKGTPYSFARTIDDAWLQFQQSYSVVEPDIGFVNGRQYVQMKYRFVESHIASGIMTSFHHYHDSGEKEFVHLQFFDLDEFLEETSPILTASALTLKKQIPENSPGK